MPPEHGRADVTLQRARTILEHVQDAIVVTDPDGVVRYLNQAARELVGVDAETVDGWPMDFRRYVLETFDVRSVNGRDVQDDEAIVDRALRGAPYRDAELVVRDRATADIRMFVISGRTVRDEEQITVLTIRDETGRWKAQHRFRTTFDTDPAPSVVARLSDAQIIMANHGMVELTGVAREELLSGRLQDVELLSTNHQLPRALEALRQGHTFHKHRASLHQVHDGDLDVLVSARSLELDGEACGIFTFVDVSDLERERRKNLAAQAELAHARIRLSEQRENERGRLARDLHDGVLQNLLAYATDMAMEERTHRDAGNPAAADSLARCRAALLASAKELRIAIRGLRPAAIREFGLWASLHEAASDMRRPGGPEVTLPVEEPPELPDAAMLALYRAAQEGIRNAIKHADADHVIVVLDVAEGDVVLEIHDDGKGFSVPERLAVLERDDHFGLLGLHERAAAQGGSLEVLSRPGRGTILRFRVPANVGRVDDGPS
jgi:PAS domain S-box-containing protein